MVTVHVFTVSVCWHLGTTSQAGVQLLVLIALSPQTKPITSRYGRSSAKRLQTHIGHLRSIKQQLTSNCAFFHNRWRATCLRRLHTDPSIIRLFIQRSILRRLVLHRRGTKWEHVRRKYVHHNSLLFTSDHSSKRAATSKGS